MDVKLILIVWSKGFRIKRIIDWRVQISVIGGFGGFLPLKINQKINLKKSYGEEFTETTGFWCSRIRNICQRLEFVEINSNRKFIKWQETTTYSLLVRHGTQGNIHQEMKLKSFQW